LGFLGKGRYDALVVHGRPDDPAAVAVDTRPITAWTKLTVDPER